MAEVVRVASQPGSRPAGRAAAGLGASRFDPSRLGWNVPDNLRWLAEQEERPPYMPCGELTGSFLINMADRFERMAATARIPYETLRVTEAHAALYPETSEARQALLNLASVIRTLCENPESTA